jgi:hypothetical protein
VVAVGVVTGGGKSPLHLILSQTKIKVKTADKIFVESIVKLEKV